MDDEKKGEIIPFPGIERPRESPEPGLNGPPAQIAKQNRRENASKDQDDWISDGKSFLNCLWRFCVSMLFAYVFYGIAVNIPAVSGIFQQLLMVSVYFLLAVLGLTTFFYALFNGIFMAIMIILYLYAPIAWMKRRIWG